ncbi:MAG: YDG domain-containing protein, partial [Bacteroidota bacterium]
MKNILLLKNARLLRVLSFALFFFVFGTIGSYGQTYYSMSSGNYSETFTSWSSPATGVNWSSVGIITNGSIPIATTTTNSSAAFTTGSTGGLQNGGTNIQFLSTDGGTNTRAVAFDLNLNFFGRTAGTFSFDAAQVLNSTGNRPGTLKVYYSIDGATWTELTGTNLPYTVINNVASSAAISITLPSALDNQSTVKLRFYQYNGSGTVGSGSRPKISVDNVAVTSTSSGAAGPTLTAAAGATVDAPFTVTFTDDSAWRTAITGVTVGGTALTAGYSVSAGQITFTPSASVPAGLLQASGTKTIAVLATTYSPSTVSQTIGAGVAAKLSMNTQPAAPATNGGALATQPKVNILDQYNNATTSTASITAAVGDGAWTIGGTTSVAALAGVTTFTNLTATSLAAVTGATITFTSGSLTAVTSGTFNVPSPPPANDLCGNAQSLTVNGGTVSGTMVAATNTASGFSYAGTSRDVWYKFTPLATGSHTISLTFTLAASRDIDVDIFASATCPTGAAAFTAHGAASVTTETITNTFTFGTTYYIRAIDFGATNGGAFTIVVTGPSAPVITGTATATAFTTTYGTASAEQSFAVSGTGLTANLVATAPTGYEVSSDGTTYGTTATFTQTGGNASGSLRIRLKANAAVVGSHDSQNIVLSSTGATSVNITTAASGNTVTAKALTVTADNRTKPYNTSLTLGTSAFTTVGLANAETVGSVTLSAGGAASTATTPVGTYPITATTATGGTFTASNYTISYVDGVLTITQASQTITALATPVTKTYGDATYSIATTATSGLTVTYSSSDAAVASVASDGTVTIHTTGTATLTASQAGDSNYSAASDVTQALTVNPKTLTITGLTANNKDYDGNTDATLSGTASLSGIVSGDEANVSLTGTPTASFDNATVGNGKTVTVTGYSLNGVSPTYTYYTLAPLTLLANIVATTPTLFTSGTLSAVDTTYGTASSVTSFSVSAQSLTEGILVSPPAGYEVSLSSGSGYGSTVIVGGAGNVSSTTVYVRIAATTAVGSYSGNITLSSDGAVSLMVATVSSTVSQKNLTITGLTGVDKTYDGSGVATVTGTPTLNGVVGSDDVTVAGTPSFAFADANAGINKTITVLGYSLNGTAAANYTVSQPTGLFATVNKADQTIAAISASETRTFGDGTYSVATTSDSGLTVTYSSSDTAVATVSAGGTVTIVGAGSTTITVSQAGNSNYNPATSVTQALTVNKASQMLSALTTPVTKVFGGAPYSAASTASSGLTVSYSSDNTAVATVSAAGLVTIVGTGSAIITASQAGNANYDPATSVTQELTVGKGDQTITLAATDTKTTASAPYTLTANASSGLTITYVSSNTAVATISGNTVTIVGLGDTTITANQAGNDNYNPAPEATQVLTVTLPACASVSGTTSYNFGAATPWTASPTSAQSNVTAGAITQGNNFGTAALLSSTSPSTTAAYATASGTGNAGIPANIGALNTTTTTNAYFAFTVTPVTGYNFTLNGISFGSRSTSTGPQAYSLRSSLDNYATDIATGTMLANSTYALKSNTGLTVTGNGNANPVTFRLYGHSGAGNPSSGSVNWRIDDLTLSLSTSNTPSVATVGANQSVCGLTSTALGGNTPAVGTGTWSQISGPGTSTYSSVNSGASTATATVAGTYVYRWSITNGCATSYSADVTVEYKTPAAASITEGGSTTFCDGGSVTLTANEGLSYLWSNGATTQSISATATGDYTVTVTGANGCPATSAATTVTATPNTTNTTAISACDTYTWSVNGATYTTSGSYSLVSGCHTEVLNLTINTTVTSEDVTAAACDTYTWSFNGATYTASGDYTATVNCNTTTLHLTITPSSSNTTTTSACETFTWSAGNGQTYTTSGSYTHVTGCHTEILALTINPATSSSESVTACDTYTWSVNGQTYTNGGTYTAVGTNAAGCTDTKTLVLTLNNSTTSSESISACDTYTWSVNGETYTSSGTYTSVGINAAGCPDTKILNLTITPSSTNVTEITACDS